MIGIMNVIIGLVMYSKVKTQQKSGVILIC